VSYEAGAWLPFGAALAGVAGALTGLLFVAVSIKSDVLARSRNLSSRAAQTLVLFMIPVLLGLLVVAPQHRIALGGELIGLAALSGLILQYLDRRAGSAGRTRTRPSATSSASRPT
jgi:O-antigen/teichoic acid export membrane protein